MMRTVPLALLLSASVAGCLSANGEGLGGPDDRDLALTWKAGQPSATIVRAFDGSPWQGAIDARPTVADVNGDGRAEVLIHGRDRNVRIFSDDGVLLATLPVTYPASWRVDDVLNPVAVGSLDGTGRHVVVAGPAALVTAWVVEPGGKGLHLSKLWETRADTCRTGSGMDAPAVLVDLDGRPGMEVLVHTEQVGLYALRGDGSILWHHCWGGGNSAPVAGDLDGDGDVEAVFASDGGFISVLDGKTGAPQWTFDASDPAYGISPASVVTAPTIADIDGKGPKEILFTARHAPRDDPDAYGSFHMGIFAIHQDMETYEPRLVWLRQPAWAHPMSNTPLLVDDVDGDGRMDIFGMDWNTIGHSPGAWEPLPEVHVFRLDDQGRDVWVRELPAWWSNKDLAIMDADGDGDVEILVAAPRGDRDGIWRLDAANGTPEGFLSAGPWTLSTGPVLTAKGFVVAGSLHGTDRCAVLFYALEGA